MSKICSLIFAVAVLTGVQAARGQSADIPRHGTSLTGLNDPEPAEPRYLNPSELARLKAQVQTLQETYGQVSRQLAPPVATPDQEAPASPANAQPNSSMSLRKP